MKMRFRNLSLGAHTTNTMRRQRQRYGRRRVTSLARAGAGRAAFVGRLRGRLGARHRLRSRRR